jgi:hypothetical protein
MAVMGVVPQALEAALFRYGTLLASPGSVMSWFDVADGRLRCRGRITRQPIREWLASTEGTTAVAATAQEIRFSLFGRTRAARRRMQRDLWNAIGARSLREAIAAECDRYLAAWTELAYAPSLPRLTISSHRLVVVPRVMIVGRSMSGICARIAASLETPAATAQFKNFLSRWLLGQMDEAIRSAGPSPKRPVHARESWACVGLDRELVWIDPLWTGPEWRGHAVMFEMPAPRLQRRDRRELEEAIGDLRQSLPLLTRQQRDNAVRLANDQMKGLRF